MYLNLMFVHSSQSQITRANGEYKILSTSINWQIMNKNCNYDKLWSYDEHSFNLSFRSESDPIWLLQPRQGAVHFRFCTTISRM